MQINQLLGVGTNYTYRFPNSSELFDYWVEYGAKATGGKYHRIRIGFGTPAVCGSTWPHLVVWIDEHPSVEFTAADDFDVSDEVPTKI